MGQKLTVRVADGKIEEKELEDIKPAPIVSTTLSEELLQRIKAIYEGLHDVIFECSSGIKTLESFEIIFMRDDFPEISVGSWERILFTYQEGLKMFGTEMEAKIRVYNTIMFYAFNILSEEDQQNENIKKLIDIFNSYRKDGQEDV